MNKNELVTKMSELSGLTKVDSVKALDAFIKGVFCTYGHFFSEQVLKPLKSKSTEAKSILILLLNIYAFFNNSIPGSFAVPSPLTYI